MMGLSSLGVPVDRSTVTAVTKQFNVGEGQSRQGLEESSLGQGRDSGLLSRIWA